MPGWLKTKPSVRSKLAVVSFDAEGLYHIVRVYCADVGNDGKLLKGHLAAAVGRKIPESRARKAMAELVAEGRFIDNGDSWEPDDWKDDQPKAAVWDDDVQRERWARKKQLLGNKGLCQQIKNRDQNLCRFCGVRVNWADKVSASGGTYDHSDPDAGNSLDNVTVACRRCNGRKRDRTPEQAKMPLLPPGTIAAVLIGSSPESQSDQVGGADPIDQILTRTRETGTSQPGQRSGADRIEPDRTDPGHDITGQVIPLRDVS